MAQPATYSRQFDFTDFATDFPASPPPGASIDAELDAVKTTLDGTLTNLAMIQRDDGALKNGLVRLATLHSDVIAALLINGATISAWATATDFTMGQIVLNDDDVYLVGITHTSGVLADDIAAFKLILMFNPAADSGAQELIDALEAALSATTGATLVATPDGTVQAVLDGLRTDVDAWNPTVGLYSEVAATPPNIPAIVTMVRTSGNVAAGLGAADYVYDSSFDLATYPLAGFTDALGRTMRLNYDQTISDFMFGASDSTSISNKAAIEATGAFVWAFKCREANIFSKGRSTTTVTFGTDSFSLTTKIRFGATIKAAAQMDDIVYMPNIGFCSVDFGGCYLYGRVSAFDEDTDNATPPLSARLALNGLRIGSCNRAYCTGTITVIGMYYWAVVATEDGFSSFGRLPFIRAFNCGSSRRARAANTGSGLQATWSAGAQVGSAGSLNQTTTLTVTAVPAFDDPNGLQRCVNIDEYLYRIVSITGSGPYTLTLSMPWVPSATLDAGGAGMGTGTLTYVFGGKLAIQGGDWSNMWLAGGEAVRCGFALLDQATYGATAENLATEQSDVLLGFGRGTNNANSGGRVLQAYVEQEETVQVLSFSNAVTGRTMCNIAGQGVLTAKWLKHGPRNASGTLDNQLMAEFTLLEHAPSSRFIAGAGGAVTSAAFNIPNIAAGAAWSTTVSIPGYGPQASATAALSKIGVRLSESFAGLMVWASITAINADASATATVVFFNPPGGSDINPASGTLYLSLDR